MSSQLQEVLVKALESPTSLPSMEMLKNVKQAIGDCGATREEVKKEIDQVFGNSGLNFDNVRKDVVNQQRVLRGMGKNGLQVVLVKQNRQIEARYISPGSSGEIIGNIMGTKTYSEDPCSRLGADIVVYHNRDNKNKNRLGSRLVGFQVGGDILIVNPFQDLPLQTILEYKKKFA